MSSIVNQMEMPKKFIHIRCYTKEEVLVPHGGLTIAYWEVIPERTPQNGDSVVFEVAVARCHPNDNFCRRIGREVAAGKLEVGECWILEVGIDDLENIYDLMTEFALTKDTELGETHDKVLAEREAKKNKTRH